MSTKLKQRAGWKAATAKTFGGFSQTSKESLGSFKISANAGIEKNLDEEPKIDFVNGNENKAGHGMKK